jgi:hypothetical protein
MEKNKKYTLNIGNMGSNVKWKNKCLNQKIKLNERNP